MDDKIAENIIAILAIVSALLISIAVGIAAKDGSVGFLVFLGIAFGFCAFFIFIGAYFEDLKKELAKIKKE
ncbi:MAG: hypothetical protein HYW78_03955 [Parcubacteria group bacterium]|nr:hypothetical protein [Parcubacteria group bacterium]